MLLTLSHILIYNLVGKGFLDLSFFSFSIMALAILFAGISKGGFGSGAAFVAAPILTTIVGPEPAIGLMLPLLMLMDITGLYFYWGRWEKKAALILILGGIPGVIFGALFFSIANPYFLKGIIGFIAISYVFNQLAFKNLSIPFSKKLNSNFFGYILATISGFTSCISHAGGPPAAIYLLSKNISKTEFQATTILIFWVINIFKLFPFIYFGFVNTYTLTFSLWLIPMAFLGTWIGVKLHFIISEKFFYALINCLLFLTGAKLIYDAFVGLFAF